MKIEHGEVIFSSGRTRDANGGIIGLGPDGDVSQGYDGGFWSPRIPDIDVSDDPLTKADLVELADYMIAQWQAFKERHK